MNAAYFDDTEVAAACGVTAHSATVEIGPGKHIGVAEFRELAAHNPDAFRPDLASSLNNLAIRLSELGRREEALEPA